ncbi:hypothetical protein BH20ACT3_BH20ACT3_07090 [soil metagenome]
MRVRGRTDDDLDACERLAGVVHRVDGYPVYLPDDLRSFIATPDAHAAWMAEHHGEGVGHVALHPRSSEVVMALASEVTGRPPERLGVVARLLVDPAARGLGVGRALLAAATDGAGERGLWPVLDVATHYGPALRLYEACDWVRAGQVTVTFRHGGTLDEYVYLGPAPPVP